MSSKAILYLKIWLTVYVGLLLATVPSVSYSDESNNPIYVLYEFEDPDLEVYTRSLVDVLNVLRFRDRRDEVETYPEERVDIIFVSQRGSILEDNFAPSVLQAIGPEYAQALSSRGPVTQRCSIHEVVFSTEATIVGIQNVDERKLDIECVHIALAFFLGVKFDDFEDLTPEEELRRIFGNLPK